MKWLDDDRIRVLVTGVFVGLVLSSGTANADFIFGEPVNLGPTVNNAETWQGEPSISADGLELYFVSERPGGQGGGDIWVTTRSTKAGPWGQPVNLGPVVNSPVDERGPCIAARGLQLYFVSKVSGKWYIYVSTRQTKNAEWGTPVKLPNNPSFGVDSASVSSDGLELYYSFYYDISWYDIHVMKRNTTNEPWPAGVVLGSNVNHQRNNYQNNDMSPCISYDGLALFYSLGSGKVVDYELFMSTRPSAEEPWSPCVKLDAINSSGWDFAPSVSADGSMLYFESDRPGCIGVDDIWQAPIVPIVDLNSDGIVDAGDMCMILEHWGEDYPLCDIGPMPWGDSIVDVEDLKILAEHLSDKTGLVAHWPLDEIEGALAGDVVGGNDGFVIGGASWLPAGGMVDGAVELDGVEDFISTLTVLNPADGPFSVLAWIKGGAPGQVIVAQQVTSDWLSLDAEGRLMTVISCGEANGPLLSETVVTDAQWHRVGLVWDGSNRTLIVDDVVVAEDMPTTLESSDRGLYIGVGNDFSADTFFSGLIDDVRIYNRAVMP